MSPPGSGLLDPEPDRSTSVTGPEPERLPRTPIAGVLAILVAGFVLVHWWGESIVESGRNIKLGFPPLHAVAETRGGRRLLVPVAIGGLYLAVIPVLARRGSWRLALLGAFVAAVAWTVVLNGTDGVEGLLHGLSSRRHEYLADVHDVGSPVEFLRGFVDNINSYATHTRGHPPGFVLVLWVLDRIGFEGLEPAATLCILAGASAVPFTLVAVRDVAGEPVARAALPYVGVAPAALWMATSADAFFTGLAAGAVALIVLATGRADDDPRGRWLAAGGGILFGLALMCSYGLALLVLVPLGVVVRRQAWRSYAIWLAGGAAVLLVFLALGFNWVAGLQTTRGEYQDGVASVRPYGYFLIANVVVAALAMGPATIAGVTTLAARRFGRPIAGPQGGLLLLVAGAVAAMAVANLSGMSKAEVERIWLPFMVWVLPAAAVLAPEAPRRERVWLGSQLTLALAVQTWLVTGW